MSTLLKFVQILKRRGSIFVGFKSVSNKIEWAIKLTSLLLLGTEVIKLVNHLIQSWRYNTKLYNTILLQY